MSLQKLTPLRDLGTQSEIMPIDCVSDKETRQRHIDLAVSRGLPECKFTRQTKPGKLAIVASAPSVGDYVDVLKEWDGEIWGINGAFAWMMKRGIKPNAFVGVDPEWFLKDYLIDMPDEATYYIASQVHPDVFDHLAGKNVQLWHMSDREVTWPIGSIHVHGGSTCLTRCPWLAYMLGWQDVHIFGGDSSFTDKTHVYGGEIPSNFCFAEADGEVFRTHKVMMVQATDMVDLVQSFPGTITVYGRGFMQSLVSCYKKTGLHEWLAQEEAAEIQGMNRRQRRAMKKSAA